MGHDDVRGYYLDFSAKTTSPSAAAPLSLVPSGIAQLALGWHERLLSGETEAEDRFLSVCALLEDSSVQARDARLWPYRDRQPKYDLEPPWISGLAARMIERRARRDSSR